MVHNNRMLQVVLLSLLVLLWSTNASDAGEVEGEEDRVLLLLQRASRQHSIQMHELCINMCVVCLPACLQATALVMLAAVRLHRRQCRQSTRMVVHTGSCC